MKFIMAYSGGKDCTLALDRMISQGNDPVCLFTTVTKKQLNFKHGIRHEVFAQYEACLGIPVVSCYGDVIHEEQSIYTALQDVITRTGATALCTGDIYRADVYAWNKKMADSLGLELVTPLWNESTEKLLDELIDKGYKCCIKVVKTNKLPKEVLGRVIDRDFISSFRDKIDICGEDGEYHSLTVDGPIFRRPLHVRFGSVLCGDDIAMMDVTPDKIS